MKNQNPHLLYLLIFLVFLSCNNHNKEDKKETKNLAIVKNNTIQVNIIKPDAAKETTAKENNVSEHKSSGIKETFLPMEGLPNSEPTLTGEYLSKLNPSNFKIITVKVDNTNGIEDDEKTKTIEILCYQTMKGYLSNKPNYNKRSSDEPNIIRDPNTFDFLDSSGYCVGSVEFYDNVFDKKPDCTYQIVATRKFIYENEKGKMPFQSVYPARFLRLCK